MTMGCTEARRDRKIIPNPSRPNRMCVGLGGGHRAQPVKAAVHEAAATTNDTAGPLHALQCVERARWRRQCVAVRCELCCVVHAGA